MNVFIMLGEKTDSKNHILYDSLYDALEKTELLRQIVNQWSLGKGVDYIKGNLEGNVTALHLDCGGGYITLWFSQNSIELYTKKKFVFPHVNFKSRETIRKLTLIWCY